MEHEHRETPKPKYAVGDTVKYGGMRYTVSGITSALSNAGPYYRLVAGAESFAVNNVREDVIGPWTIKDEAIAYLNAEEDAVNERIREAKREVTRLNTQIYADLEKLNNINAAKKLF